ncbi:helix-turn-helix transcriptional regulator [Enterobacter sp.]|uniref:helix-turn-helix transcriptional regulator n=1 Tax=Enterobacter sp. TaxID=42895 RepID=UPI00296EF044|nr:WYL domain-containing protein [Enterobacter sp.]
MGNRNLLLASRIADILLRLNNGQTLHLDKLAEDYGVNKRTIRRDIDERLCALPLERDEKTGGYRLSPGLLGRFDSNSIEIFSKMSGVKGLFPALNKSILNAIASPSAQQNFLVHGHKYISSGDQSENFSRLQIAIDGCRRVNFSYTRNDLRRTYHVAPYKLINFNGVWYLAAEHDGRIKNFTLTKISELDCTFETFIPDEALLNHLKQEESVWGKTEKFEVVLKVSSAVAEYFLRRQLLNEQVVEKKMADGGLILSTQISHKKEILPIVQYWIPHMKIIAPEILQKELEHDIKNWLDE